VLALPLVLLLKGSKMMTTEQLKQASKLLDEVERIEKLIAVYREVEEVIVGTIKDSTFQGTRYSNEIRLTGSEIRDRILDVLASRTDKTREELRALGVS
jgi:hypothetical protein